MSYTTNNLNKNNVKVPKNYPCLCIAVNLIISWSRYVLILPLKLMTLKNNHFNTGCTLQTSKIWLSISIVFQILIGVYIFTTTIARICFDVPTSVNEKDWYLMTISYFVIQIEMLVSISLGTYNAKRIGKLFERLSRLNGSIGEMRSIHDQSRFVLFLLLTCFTIFMLSFLYVAYERLDEFNSINLINFIDSPPGVVIRGLVNLIAQVQCALVCTMCLIISSKFQHLSETIKSTLEYATLFPSDDKTKTARKIKTSTIKWMATVTDMSSNNIHWEEISDQHQETMYCLSELNDCFGIQLLTTFTTLIFATVYYSYRTIQLNNNENYMTNRHQRYHCIIALIFNLKKLFLYISMGHKISKQCKEPVRELQRGKLLYLPIHRQQQIQSLIMQWLSLEPCYLSAYNVINIGPWLIAPIVGNAITYLLVAIQFK